MSVEMLRRALIRMLWRSVADDAQCTCCDGDTCAECDAMEVLGLGCWVNARYTQRQLESLGHGGRR